MPNHIPPMRMCLAALLLTSAAHSQWILQNSGTTASLRGIHAVPPQFAWASVSNGTVFRTEDSGLHWQHCTVPPDADKLDFRASR